MQEFPSLGLQQRTSQTQKQIQTQTQKLSQQQLLSIKLLAMGSQDLRREIYDTVAKNPALIITSDKTVEGVKSAVEKGTFSDNLRLGSVTQAGREASDNFQRALEAAPDETETLSQHLEQQFLSMNHSPSEEALGLKLIYNLDSKGFHILAPYSLLDKNDPAQTTALLEKTMDTIRQLDPSGTCCRNVEESLYVQAKFRGDAPPEALFILHGHLDFLNPFQPARIIKKIRDYQFYVAEEIILRDTLDFSERNLLKVFEYIKTLDPYPARNFSQTQNTFITPDVFVEKDEDSGELIVRVDDETLPAVEISRDFQELARDRTRVTKSTEQSEKKRSEHRFVMDSVRSANEFLESIAFRRRILLLACQQIVSAQSEFFEKGQRYLKPLRQKDIAAAVGIHEATVSRMAKEKYIRCEQGLFPISFFFSSAAPQSEFSADKTESAAGSDVPSSKTAVMFELQKILEEHKNDDKTLSDQKLSDILSQRGIKVARRTVAKYRSQLNIDSSYNR